MDVRQRNLIIRNAVGGLALLALVLVVMAFFGVFEGDRSDEAQVRRLIGVIQDEINDHDWDDLLRLCDLTPEEAGRWRDSIPRQADLVSIEAITPKGFISVPEGALEYEIDVNVIARLEVPIVAQSRPQSVNGTLYFVKRDGIWRLDLHRSAPTFPYLPRPRMGP